MSHHHHHHTGLQCACCNPLWKAMLPELPFEIENSVKSQKSTRVGETLIFRTGTDPNNTNDQKVGYIQTLQKGEDVMVEAIGIKDGLIVATGTYESVLAQMPNGTSEQIIYGGQTLLPGLIEPHVHILPTAVFNMATDVSPFLGQELRVNTPDGAYNKKWVLSALKLKASSTGDTDTWIFGRNVDPSLFDGTDKGFVATDLDGISTQQPVFIMNSSMHLAYINSLAIDLVNQYYTTVPADSKYYGYKVESDGVLKEVNNLLPVVAVIGKSLESKSNLSPKEFAASFAVKIKNEVDKIFADASSKGVTYVFDAGIDPAVKNGFSQPEFLKYIANQEDCCVGIGGALAVDTPTYFEDNVNKTYTPNSGDHKFNLAYVKIVTDGSNQGLTGYQKQPYCCDANFNLDSSVTNTGISNYNPPSAVDNIVAEVVANHWPIMVHANGDQALDLTIDAFQKAGISNENIDARRDRIEHASLLSDQNLTDMQQLGVSPSFLIGHVGYWGWVFRNTILGKERSHDLDRCNSAVAKGMRITLHSDNSVTPLGPLRMMEQAISRVMEAAPEGVHALNHHECITRFQALKAMTYDAAWQCHAEKWIGSLEVGKYADLVILAQSPLTYNNIEAPYSVKGMRDIPVLETWKGGIKRYAKEVAASATRV